MAAAGMRRPDVVGVAVVVGGVVVMVVVCSLGCFTDELLTVAVSLALERSFDWSSLMCLCVRVDANKGQTVHFTKRTNSIPKTRQHQHQRNEQETEEQRKKEKRKKEKKRKEGTIEWFVGDDAAVGERRKCD